MNSLKIVGLILLLGILCSCTAAEDKYPELQMFDKEDFSKKVLIEEASFYEELITDTKDYIFTYRLNNGNYRKGLIIRDKKNNKKLEMELPIKTYVSIDSEGNIYFLSSDEQICYRLTPPLFQKKNN